MRPSAPVDEFADVLTDAPADSAAEVFRRCGAADSLGALGAAAAAAVPALARTLCVRVAVDCEPALRVAAARALWRVGRRADLALPHLIEALRDEYWGAARTAVETLAEMGRAGQPAAAGLVSLARKRLRSGPFHFEEWAEDSTLAPPSPLLAEIAAALGRCAAGGPEAREVLEELAAHPDGLVRASAEAALEEAAGGRSDAGAAPDAAV